jgi:hypothetical protein
MKQILGLLFTLMSLHVLASQRPDDSIWDRLLKDNVTNDGRVDYKGFKKKTDTLDAYLYELINYAPKSDWSSSEKKAYYINAYNAYTVKLVLAKYPLTSVKDAKFSGKDIWSVRLVKLGEKTYTLGQIENDILRKMNDARIHFAINCASISCPRLYNRAFTNKNLEGLLNKLTRAYINDTRHNIIREKKVQLSQIFDWYAIDFVTEKQSLIDYLNQFSELKINQDAKIEYLPYNWNLNE